MKRNIHLFSAGLLALILAGSLIVASNGQARSAVLAIVTCATTAPCTGGTNFSTGPGVQGQSAKGYGVVGNTTFASTNNAAVFGLSTNSIGVVSQSTNYLGLYGSGPTYGVYGSSGNGYAIVGVSSATGAYGSGTSFRMYANTSTGRRSVDDRTARSGRTTRRCPGGRCSSRISHPTAFSVTML